MRLRISAALGGRPRPPLPDQALVTPEAAAAGPPGGGTFSRPGRLRRTACPCRGAAQTCRPTDSEADVAGERQRRGRRIRLLPGTRAQFHLPGAD